MTRTTLVRVLVVMVIMTLLGGASLIIVKNSAGSVVEAPSGWVH